MFFFQISNGDWSQIIILKAFTGLLMSNAQMI